jgi:hypothetical protein
MIYTNTFLLKMDLYRENVNLLLTNINLKNCFNIEVKKSNTSLYKIICILKNIKNHIQDNYESSISYFVVKQNYPLKKALQYAKKYYCFAQLELCNVFMDFLEKNFSILFPYLEDNRTKKIHMELKMSLSHFFHVIEGLKFLSKTEYEEYYLDQICLRRKKILNKIEKRNNSIYSFLLVFYKGHGTKLNTDEIKTIFEYL